MKRQRAQFIESDVLTPKNILKHLTTLERSNAVRYLAQSKPFRPRRLPLSTGYVTRQLSIQLNEKLHSLGAPKWFDLNRSQSQSRVRNVYGGFQGHISRSGTCALSSLFQPIEDSGSHNDSDYHHGRNRGANHHSYRTTTRGGRSRCSTHRVGRRRRRRRRGRWARVGGGRRWRRDRRRW